MELEEAKKAEAETLSVSAVMRLYAGVFPTDSTALRPPLTVRNPAKSGENDWFSDTAGNGAVKGPCECLLRRMFACVRGAIERERERERERKRESRDGGCLVLCLSVFAVILSFDSVSVTLSVPFS